MSLELRARNNHAAVLGSEDALASLEVLWEAHDLANRVGNQQMLLWIAGTYAYGSVYVGRDWDTALAVLDSALERSRSRADRARLLALRILIMTWRGQDVARPLAEWESLREAVSDPDVEAWSHNFPAMQAQLEGHPEAAIAGFRRAIPLAVQQISDARLGLIRAAHWARDLEAAREGEREARAENYGGRFVEAEQTLAQAGVAALEGRRDDALASYRASIELSRLQNADFDLAMTQLSALILLPDEPSIAGWADEARERFEIVKSPPLLARLDEALAARVA
jgi:hypothetical protein